MMASFVASLLSPSWLLLDLDHCLGLCCVVLVDNLIGVGGASLLFLGDLFQNLGRNLVHW